MSVYTLRMVLEALLDGLEYSLIADKNAEWLDKLFDNEEVLGVITGFYGVITGSWTNFVLKTDLMVVFHNLYATFIG